MASNDLAKQLKQDSSIKNIQAGNLDLAKNDIDLSSSVPTDITVSEDSSASLNTSSVISEIAYNKALAKSDRQMFDPSKLTTHLEWTGRKLDVNSNRHKDDLIAAIDNIPCKHSTYSELFKEYSDFKLYVAKQIYTLNSDVKLKNQKIDYLNSELTKYRKESGLYKAEAKSLREDLKSLRELSHTQERRSTLEVHELKMESLKNSIRLETLEKVHSLIERMLCSDKGNGHGVDQEIALETFLHMEDSAGIFPLTFKSKLQESFDLCQRLSEEREYLKASKEECAKKLRHMEEKFLAMQLQLSTEKLEAQNKYTESNAIVAVKDFELKRMSALFNDVDLKLKFSQSENEAIKTKIGLLTEQKRQQESSSSFEIARLSLELRTVSSRLSVYDSMENRLDKLVVDAAAVASTSNISDILNVCDHQTSLPLDTRKRLEQAVKLGTRVCELEKDNAEQKAEVFSLRNQREDLRRETSALQMSLRMMPEPASRLILTISDKNRELGKAAEDNNKLAKENVVMKEKFDQMSRELEVLKKYNESLFNLHKSKVEIKLNKDAVKEVDSATSNLCRKSACTFLDKEVSSHVDFEQVRPVQPAQSEEVVVETINLTSNLVITLSDSDTPFSSSPVGNFQGPDYSSSSSVFIIPSDFCIEDIDEYAYEKEVKTLYKNSNVNAAKSKTETEYYPRTEFIMGTNNSCKARRSASNHSGNNRPQYERNITGRPSALTLSKIKKSDTKFF